MELFVIIVNGWKSLTIITKSPILDVVAVLDPPLVDLILTKFSEQLFFIIRLHLSQPVTLRRKFQKTKEVKQIG